MTEATQDPDMAPFGALAGEWTVEMTHPASPGLVVRGRAAFEWLEGGRYLIQRQSNDHPDFPDTLAVIGPAEAGGIAMFYFDSRGVQRVYGARMSDGVLRFSRDAEEFCQRFEGTLDGDTLEGLWKMSHDDGATWADDLAITYRRAG